MILNDADTDADKEGGAMGLSFSEFMSCLEGDAIDFDDYLRSLDKHDDQPDREACRIAFEQERNSLTAVVKGPRAKPVPKVVKLELSAEERQARLAAKGMLRLHIQSASGLQPMDKNGKADPYVLALLGKKEQRTGTRHKTLAPVWEETLEWKKAPPLEKVLGKGLRLQLKDEDKGVLDADDLIGKLKVSLESLADHDSAIFEEAFKPQGTLCFWVMWVPSSKGANGKKNDKDATSATSAREPPVLEAEAETEVEATPENKKKKMKKKKDNHKAEEAQ